MPNGDSAAGTAPRQNARMAPGSVRVGISGWIYPGWRGVFYPPGLSQKRELDFASRAVRAIEINGTFYSLQRPSSFRAWHDATPADFVFALKGPRFVTHMLKLKGAGQALSNFFASGPLALGAKLGPILWQLPEMVRFDAARLTEFFRQLPRTTAEAAALARGHDHRVKGEPVTEALDERPLRHALEVRSPTFLVPDFVALLRRHDVALVFADSAGLWPYAEDVTADFVYVRLHGASELYASGYRDDELRWWADRLAAWSAGGEPADARRLAGPADAAARDAFVFFDNDAKVHAPFDAQRLAALLGVSPPAAAAAAVPARPVSAPPRRALRGGRASRSDSPTPS